MKPACMTDAEYREWQDRNSECRHKAASPCSDCPLEWALEQEKRGNCLVWNGVDYVLGTPRGDEGRLPHGEVVRRSRRRNGQKSITAEYAHLTRMREADRLRDEGMRPSQIARHMGIHIGTARRYLREMAA